MCYVFDCLSLRHIFGLMAPLCSKCGDCKKARARIELLLLPSPPPQNLLLRRRSSFLAQSELGFVFERALRCPLPLSSSASSSSLNVVLLVQG